MTIKIGILGYGNLGKGVEYAVSTNHDMELVGIFTKREPALLKPKNVNTPIYSINDVLRMKDKIDVMILCGSSIQDLPYQSAEYAKHFNIVDSFDNHQKISEHFNTIHINSLCTCHVSIISVGWDPGLFSLNRLYAQAILPHGKNYTFWGKGISQGHSDAIRRIEGVLDARQYTIPNENALTQVYTGNAPNLTAREKHTRECYVVTKENTDLKQIENEIKSMPNYFADYDTIVHFISQEELDKKHSGMPHGGVVIHTGKTGINKENKHIIEYHLKLDSNPEFTANILIAYARAAYRLVKEKQYGCKTVFDIPPAYLHPDSPDNLRKYLL